FERARIGPVALQHRVAKAPLFEVILVHIRNLQLAPAAGLERPDYLEDVGRINVNAGDGTVALGPLRFFLDADDALAFQLRHAVTAGVVDLLQSNPGTLGSTVRRRQKGAKRIVKNVVAENGRAALALAEEGRKPEGLGDATGLVLNAIREATLMLAT